MYLDYHLMPFQVHSQETGLTVERLGLKLPLGYGVWYCGQQLKLPFPNTALFEAT